MSPIASRRLQVHQLKQATAADWGHEMRKAILPIGALAGIAGLLLAVNPQSVSLAFAHFDLLTGTLMVLGVHPAIAAAAALLQRLSLVAVPTFGGAIAYLVLRGRSTTTTAVRARAWSRQSGPASRASTSALQTA